MLLNLLRRSAARSSLPCAARATQRCYTYKREEGREQTIYTGLYRDADAPGKLSHIYDETLSVLAQMPAGYYYRQTLEGTLRQRMQQLARGETDFGEGLVEEVTAQAGEELALARQMLEWKPWEGSEVE